MAAPTGQSENVGERLLLVLGYHKIGAPSEGAWDTRFYVPEETFAEHLHLLRDSAWEAIDHSALLAGLTRPEGLPPRSVLLTFDDGYRSVYDRALPRLAELGFPGVVFVPTGYVGGTSEWTVEYSEAPEPICGWQELSELQAGGVAVQSHGIMHRWLSKLTPAELEEELARSKALIEGSLGRPVETMAFPFGDGGRDPAETRAALERSGYRAAFGNRGPPMAVPPPNPFRLNRLMMFRDTDLASALQPPASSVT